MSPSRPLRVELVRCGADVNHRNSTDEECAQTTDWQECQLVDVHVWDAASHLDVFLDALEGQADEWDRLAGIAAMSHIERLVAVLREGDEQ